MKNLIIATAIAAFSIAAPTLSFAQSSQNVTRASVQAQLVQLEKAGYMPGGDSTAYPAGIEAAEAKVLGHTTPMAQTMAMRSAGSSVAGSSAMGAPKSNACVGPIGFCNIYFGS